MDHLSELRELYQLAREELAQIEVPGGGASLLRECRFLLQEISELEKAGGSSGDAVVSALDAARQRREERLKKKA